MSTDSRSQRTYDDVAKKSPETLSKRMKTRDPWHKRDQEPCECARDKFPFIRPDSSKQFLYRFPLLGVLVDSRLSRFVEGDLQAGVLEGAILRRIERDEGGKEATMARYVHGGQLTLETGVRDQRAIVIFAGNDM